MSDAKAAFARRLNEAFDRLDIPPKQRGRFTALARLFGVSPVAARDWCEGRSYPSVDKLLVILDTVRCGSDWLLYGRAPPEPRGAPDGGAAVEFDALDANPAGSAVPAEPEALQWLRVEGDAMAPTVIIGDLLGWSMPATPFLSDGLYLLGTDRPGATGMAPALLRRCQRRLDGTVEVRCDNPLYPERGQFAEAGAGRLISLQPGAPELSVLGQVRAVRRRLA